MRKARLTENERLKKGRKLKRLIDTKIENLHCNLVWLIPRPDNGKYLKKLMLNDKKEKGRRLNEG